MTRKHILCYRLRDEFADFETYRHLLSVKDDGKAPVTEADYIRSALLRGLGFEQSLGVNPYKFALIGSSDAHTGQGAADEHNFAGKGEHLWQARKL